MLNINFKENATKEDRTAFAVAVQYSGLTMSISMTEDQIGSLEKKIENKKGTYTTAEVEGFKAKKILLEADLENFQEDAASIIGVYESVRDAMIENGSDEGNVDNVLRCIAAAENSKLEKYALKNLGTVEIYNSLATCHDIKRSNDLGGQIMGKAEKAAYASAEDAIQRALREALSLEESPYTEKLTVRFNKTDLRLIHETFIKGFSNKYEIEKDDKGNEISRTYKGVKVAKSITTKKTDDGMKYDFRQFNTVVARLVIGKLAK